MADTVKSRIHETAFQDWTPELVVIDEQRIHDVGQKLAGIDARFHAPPFPSASTVDTSQRLAFMVHVSAQLFCFWRLDADGQLEKFRYKDASGSMAIMWLYDAFWKGRYLDLAGASEYLLASPMGEQRTRIAMEINKNAQDLNEQIVPRIHDRLINGEAGAEDASMLAYHFPLAFEDPYLKKAQLCISFMAGVVNDDYQDEISPDLTAFSDYQVPRVLRALGILRYQPDLASAVDSQQILGRDGVMERAIRGGTVEACLKLSQASGLSESQIDNAIWQSQDLAGDTPFHLCPTTYY